ncbi:MULTISPECIES: rRNA maturation RNase YbeY [Flavobacterium]|jgi:probable rRNA maturation factor|uniref:Endoribonuclease YbeY n=1 Tax=Flavobacterium lindanitolerans TaxID=428988 RepID=A0A497V8F9_9FLAO|nr:MULTISPECIES: rRNA maturation RNase YbeY [Flavobacterium]MBU7569845.1 rRNA maturation RNase YbeY [Flavobacterium sp.]PZO33329.1 MAG: rRNA maturation RNase YbeY [Flavobacteriaceae bacterium]PZQ85171.1 MAG: rRNA maturation RNase YbeY [Flavobacterium johnsoniae]KQS52710.1 rRNA maturation factor [Flavobacterium sp. Leaf359]MBC8643430.1 rRNA maturation RNase YbeY [Flavobacterium lindanitolerans]
MISFNYETEFELPNENEIEKWLSEVIVSESKKEGDINYIFCDDEYLHEINVKYLDHDTLTDIISFDYSIGNELHGDIFVSVERVADNAKDFNVSFDEELKRVLAHGILHFAGYKDKSEEDELLMRSKEDEKIAMFHVKQ